MNKYCVYALICPLINEVVYVGITANSYWNIKYRTQQHMHDFSWSKKKLLWIKKLKKEKQYPIGVILSQHKNKSAALKYENKVILFFRGKNIKLFNLLPKP